MRKKRFLVRRSIRKSRHELKRKQVRKKIKINKLSVKDNRGIHIANTPDYEFITYDTPKNFSFIKNTNQMNVFFNNYRNDIRNGKNFVKLGLKDISNLTTDGIAILLSFVHSYDKNKVYIKGDNPKNISLKNLLYNSGFYNHVYSKEKFYGKNPSGKAFHHISKKQVDGSKLGIILDECKNYLTPYENKKLLYNALLEAMGNTKEHAGIGFNRWLFSNIDEKSGSREICFLDLGIGILESINSKIENLISITPGIQYNPNKVKGLFDGTWNILKQSSTGEKKRGNGLKEIYKFSQIDKLKEAIVITNNVYGNLKTGEFVELPTSFGGTFYYWKI